MAKPGGQNPLKVTGSAKAQSRTFAPVSDTADSPNSASQANSSADRSSYKLSRPKSHVVSFNPRGRRPTRFSSLGPRYRMIRKQLKKHCDDGLLCREIAKALAQNSGADQSKVIESLKKIQEHEYAGMILMALRHVPELFIEHPDVFAENVLKIAKVVGDDCGFVLSALFSNNKLSDAFVKNPEKILKGVSEIINGSRDWVGSGTKAENIYRFALLKISRIDAITQMFISDPTVVSKMFIEAIKVCDDLSEISEIFRTLESPNISGAFAKDPDKIIRNILRIKRGDVYHNHGFKPAMRALRTKLLSGVFIKDPDIVAEKMAKIIVNGPDAFNLLASFPDIDERKVVEMMDSLIEIIESVDGPSMPGWIYAQGVFDAFQNERIAKCFAENPQEFVQKIKKLITLSGGKKSASQLFRALKTKALALDFSKDPDGVIKKLAALVKAMNTRYNSDEADCIISGAGTAFVGNESIAAKFSSDPSFVISRFNEVLIAARAHSDPDASSYPWGILYHVDGDMIADVGFDADTVVAKAIVERNIFDMMFITMK